MASGQSATFEQMSSELGTSNTNPDADSSITPRTGNNNQGKFSNSLRQRVEMSEAGLKETAELGDSQVSIEDL